MIADLIRRYDYCSLLPKEAAPKEEDVSFIPISNGPELVQYFVWKPEMSYNRHVTRLIKAIKGEP